MDLQVKKYQNTLEYMFGVLSQGDDSRLYKSWRISDYINQLNSINIFTISDLKNKDLHLSEVYNEVIKDIRIFIQFNKN